MFFLCSPFSRTLWFSKSKNSPKTPAGIWQPGKYFSLTWGNHLWSPDLNLEISPLMSSRREPAPNHLTWNIKHGFKTLANYHLLAIAARTLSVRLLFKTGVTLIDCSSFISIHGENWCRQLKYTLKQAFGHGIVFSLPVFGLSNTEQWTFVGLCQWHLPSLGCSCDNPSDISWILSHLWKCVSFFIFWSDCRLFPSISISIPSNTGRAWHYILMQKCLHSHEAHLELCC